MCMNFLTLIFLSDHSTFHFLKKIFKIAICRNILGFSWIIGIVSEIFEWFLLFFFFIVVDLFYPMVVNLSAHCQGPNYLLFTSVFSKAPHSYTLSIHQSLSCQTSIFSTWNAYLIWCEWSSYYLRKLITLVQI